MRADQSPIERPTLEPTAWCAHPVRTRFPPIHLAAVASIWLSLTLALGAPAAAFGRDGGGDRDVRVTGTCGKGATSKLRLKADHEAIQVEFEVHHNRAGAWRVVLVHERRVVWRGRARTRSGSGAFRIRRSVPNFAGADQVTARASGPRGITCKAAAVLGS